jgi:DNA-binding CsgD family transcriptional regulator
MNPRLIMARSLTPRQRQVAALLARGMTPNQISESLGITRRMVRIHVRAMCDKLGLPNRTALAAWAFTHGFAEEQGGPE